MSFPPQPATDARSVAPTSDATALRGSKAPRARRGDGQDTAERILEAAEQCFAERGYAGTTLRDVASAVGIRIPSLYNHFPSKADLYKAVLARAIASIQAVLQRVVSGELANDSRAVIGPMMEVLRSRPNVPKLIQYELLSGGEQLTMVLEDYVQPTLGAGAAALDEVSSSSRWKPEQRPLLLIAFYNLLIGHFTSAPLYQVMTGEDAYAPEAIERQNEFFGDLMSLLVGTGQAADPVAASAPNDPHPHAGGGTATPKE